MPVPYKQGIQPAVGVTPPPPPPKPEGEEPTVPPDPTVSDKDKEQDKPVPEFEGAILYRLDPAPNDKDKDAAQPTAVGKIGKDRKITWNSGVDGAAESKLLRAHPERYAASGAAFAEGAQTFAFDPVKNPQHLAGATIEALKGMGERGMYASIDEGKLYVKIGNQIQEFHFASGCGVGVNNVAYQDVAKAWSMPRRRLYRAIQGT